LAAVAAAFVCAKAWLKNNAKAANANPVIIVITNNFE
jgi:hypothetical protein